MDSSPETTQTDTPKTEDETAPKTPTCDKNDCPVSADEKCTATECDNAAESNKVAALKTADDENSNDNETKSDTKPQISTGEEECCKSVQVDNLNLEEVSANDNDAITSVEGQEKDSAASETIAPSSTMCPSTEQDTSEDAADLTPKVDDNCVNASDNDAEIIEEIITQLQSDNEVMDTENHTTSSLKEVPTQPEDHSPSMVACSEEVCQTSPENSKDAAEIQTLTDSDPKNENDEVSAKETIADILPDKKDDTACQQSKRVGTSSECCEDKPDCDQPCAKDANEIKTSVECCDDKTECDTSKLDDDKNCSKKQGVELSTASEVLNSVLPDQTKSLDTSSVKSGDIIMLRDSDSNPGTPDELAKDTSLTKIVSKTMQTSREEEYYSVVTGSVQAGPSLQGLQGANVESGKEKEMKVRMCKEAIEREQAEAIITSIIENAVEFTEVDRSSTAATVVQFKDSDDIEDLNASCSGRSQDVDNALCSTGKAIECQQTCKNKKTLNDDLDAVEENIVQLKGSNSQLAKKLTEMKVKLVAAEQKSLETLALEKQVAEISQKNSELSVKLEGRDEELSSKLQAMTQENEELNSRFKLLKARFDLEETKHRELQERFEELEDVEKRKTNELIQKQNTVEHLQSRLNDINHGRAQNGDAKEKSPMRLTRSNLRNKSDQIKSNICAIL